MRSQITSAQTLPFPPGIALGIALDKLNMVLSAFWSTCSLKKTCYQIFCEWWVLNVFLFVNVTYTIIVYLNLMKAVRKNASIYLWLHYR